jgi:hypothetical protein
MEKNVARKTQKDLSRQNGWKHPSDFSEYIWGHLVLNGQAVSQYFAQYHSGAIVASERSVSWNSTHLYESDITHVMVIVNRLRLKSRSLANIPS